jgi:myo-inositol-1(or 4)-monophosphatase
MLPLRPETASALEAVRAVLPILLRREGAADVRAKAPGDLVTASDLLVETTLERSLRQRHPDIAFVGEEGAQALPSDGRRVWLVDPLCGTANYAAGLPLYAINVALLEHQQVMAAVVADGSSGALYVAERGRGAWCLDADQPPRRLRASAASGLLSVDPQLAAPGSLHDFGRQFAIRVLRDGRFRVRIFATTLVLAQVAAGRLAAAVYANPASPVHLAAGLLLAEEAGAIVTDQDAAAWQLHSPVFIVTASPSLHQELVPLVRATLEALQQG